MQSLHLFSLLLIIVVHTTNAITPLPSWVQIDTNTCGFVQTASIKNAFSEMIDIASAAFDYVTEARHGSLQQDYKDVVSRTIDTYFAMSIAVGARNRLTDAISRRF